MSGADRLRIHARKLADADAIELNAVSGIPRCPGQPIHRHRGSRGDRKVLLLFPTGLMLASSLIVAGAPKCAGFVEAGAHLGIAIGGFWSISTATVMRLVPETSMPRRSPSLTVVTRSRQLRLRAMKPDQKQMSLLTSLATDAAVVHTQHLFS